MHYVWDYGVAISEVNRCDGSKAAGSIKFAAEDLQLSISDVDARGLATDEPLFPHLVRQAFYD